MDLLEDVLESARHDALQIVIILDTSDRESLTCTSLAVGEYRSVVSLDDILADGIGCFSEDLLLLRIPIIDGIEGEDFGHIFARLLHKDFTGVFEHADRAKKIDIR